MSCISNIRRHLHLLEDGQIVTTRDLLHAGKRKDVDNAVQKFVREGLIVRVARGVFVRYISRLRVPSLIEIAEVKAKAFGKQLLTHGADTLAKHGLLAQGNPTPTFYVDGSSSSFGAFGMRIRFQKACKKIMVLPDHGAGLTVRALLHLKASLVTVAAISALSPLWQNRQEIETIARSKRWMTGWLGDCFVSSQYAGPGSERASTEPEPDSAYAAYKKWRQHCLDNDLLDSDLNCSDCDFWFVDSREEDDRKDQDKNEPKDKDANKGDDIESVVDAEIVAPDDKSDAGSGSLLETAEDLGMKIEDANPDAQYYSSGGAFGGFGGFGLEDVLDSSIEDRLCGDIDYMEIDDPDADD